MKLRQKPKHVRNNIALAAAGTLTLPIMLFLVFGVHGPAVVAPEEETNLSSKPFETFFGQVKEQFAAAKAALPEEAPPVVPRAQNLNATPVVASTTSKPVQIATTTSSSTLEE